MTNTPHSVPTVVVRPPQTRQEAIAAAGLAPDADVIVVTVVDASRSHQEAEHVPR